MLRVVSVVFACLGALIVSRWAVTRRDALGRRRAFPVVSTVLALAVSAISAYPVLRHNRLEDDLSAAATTLVGSPVRITCQTMSQAWLDAHPEGGYVRFDSQGRPESTATITVGTCRDLTAWLASDSAQVSEKAAIAVHVLTHESMHLRGEGIEAVAECQAVQRDAATAELLGASAEHAHLLAQLYWTRVYPRLPVEYRSDDCRAGAALDERRGGGPW